MWPSPVLLNRGIPGEQGGEKFGWVCDIEDEIERVETGLALPPCGLRLYCVFVELVDYADSAIGGTDRGFALLDRAIRCAGRTLCSCFEAGNQRF